ETRAVEPRLRIANFALERTDRRLVAGHYPGHFAPPFFPCSRLTWALGIRHSPFFRRPTVAVEIAQACQGCLLPSIRRLARCASGPHSWNRARRVPPT